MLSDLYEEKSAFYELSEAVVACSLAANKCYQPNSMPQTTYLNIVKV